MKTITLTIVLSVLAVWGIGHLYAEQARKLKDPATCKNHEAVMAAFASGYHTIESIQYLCQPHD